MKDRLISIICGIIIGSTLHILLPKHNPQHQGNTAIEYKVVDVKKLDSCVVGESNR